MNEQNNANSDVSLHLNPVNLNISGSSSASSSSSASFFHSAAALTENFSSTPCEAPLFTRGCELLEPLTVMANQEWELALDECKTRVQIGDTEELIDNRFRLSCRVHVLQNVLFGLIPDHVRGHQGSDFPDIAICPDTKKQKIVFRNWTPGIMAAAAGAAAAQDNSLQPNDPSFDFTMNEGTSNGVQNQNQNVVDRDPMDQDGNEDQLPDPSSSKGQHSRKEIALDPTEFVDATILNRGRFIAAKASLAKNGVRPPQEGGQLQQGQGRGLLLSQNQNQSQQQQEQQNENENQIAFFEPGKHDLVLSPKALQEFIKFLFLEFQVHRSPSHAEKLRQEQGLLGGASAADGGTGTSINYEEGGGPQDQGASHNSFKSQNAPNPSSAPLRDAVELRFCHPGQIVEVATCGHDEFFKLSLFQTTSHFPGMCDANWTSCKELLVFLEKEKLVQQQQLAMQSGLGMHHAMIKQEQPHQHEQQLQQQQNFNNPQPSPARAGAGKPFQFGSASRQASKNNKRPLSRNNSNNVAPGAAGGSMQAGGSSSSSAANPNANVDIFAGFPGAGTSFNANSAGVQGVQQGQFSQFQQQGSAGYFPPAMPGGMMQQQQEQVSFSAPGGAGLDTTSFGAGAGGAAAAAAASNVVPAAGGSAANENAISRGPPEKMIKVEHQNPGGPGDSSSGVRQMNKNPSFSERRISVSELFDSYADHYDQVHNRDIDVDMGVDNSQQQDNLMPGTARTDQTKLFPQSAPEGGDPFGFESPVVGEGGFSGSQQQQQHVDGAGTIGMQQQHSQLQQSVIQQSQQEGGFSVAPQQSQSQLLQQGFRGVAGQSQVVQQQQQQQQPPVAPPLNDQPPNLATSLQQQQQQHQPTHAHAGEGQPQPAQLQQRLNQFPFNQAMQPAGPGSFLPPGSCGAPFQFHNAPNLSVPNFQNTGVGGGLAGGGLQQVGQQQQQIPQFNPFLPPQQFISALPQQPPVMLQQQQPHGHFLAPNGAAGTSHTRQQQAQLNLPNLQQEQDDLKNYFLDGQDDPDEAMRDLLPNGLTQSDGEMPEPSDNPCDFNSVLDEVGW
ncbi:unnamed protein product [Amoebophrya sp. A120]|nr:unnamed protein product [Amoebophrya sp. A120]|eukprot:GSA120T00019879001.1